MKKYNFLLQNPKGYQNPKNLFNAELLRIKEHTTGIPEVNGK